MDTQTIQCLLMCVHILNTHMSTQLHLQHKKTHTRPRHTHAHEHTNAQASYGALWQEEEFFFIQGSVSHWKTCQSRAFGKDCRALSPWSQGPVAMQQQHSPSSRLPQPQGLWTRCLHAKVGN